MHCGRGNECVLLVFKVAISFRFNNHITVYFLESFTDIHGVLLNIYVGYVGFMFIFSSLVYFNWASTIFYYLNQFLSAGICGIEYH